MYGSFWGYGRPNRLVLSHLGFLWSVAGGFWEDKMNPSFFSHCYWSNNF